MKEIWTDSLAVRRHPVLAFFARRPVSVTVLLLAAVVLGLISLRLMPLELFPSGFEPKYLSVEVPWSKGDSTVSPLTVERNITLPVEAELSTIPGVEELTASSASDGASFDMAFSGERDIDEAYAEVTDAMERARLNLPSDIGRIRVRRARASSSQWPIAFVNFSWEKGAQDPDLVLERVVLPRLEGIEGVSGVDFRGTKQVFIAVDIDQEKARDYGVDMGDLIRKLQAENFREPAGKVSTGASDVYLVADSRLRSLREIEQIPVRDGLALSEIAEVYQTYGMSSYVRVDGRPGVTAMVFMSSDANTVVVGDRLKQALEELEQDSAMQGFYIRVPWNQGDSIRESIANLMETLLWGAAFAVLVLLLFLKSVRLALVIALSIPLSMTLCVACMYFMNETINLLTLMGFTLAGGMLLDNAIVVAENIYRRGRLGDEPLGGAIRGAGEVGLALVLATGTTVIVFVSVIFLSGNDFISFMMSRIGIPVCISLGFSAAVALGVIPLAMHRFGLSGGKSRAARLKRRFFALRKRLSSALRRGGAAIRIPAGPAIVLWEALALFLGRSPDAGATSPLVARMEKAYSRVLGRMLPVRYVVLPVALLLTLYGISLLSGSMEQTDQNQGNRDRIQLSIEFPGSSDLTFAKSDDAPPERDALWAEYVLEMETLLLGSEGALEKRETAVAGGMDEEQALRRFGRTPEEAWEHYGIQNLATSFNKERARIWIYLDRERVDQASVFYERIMADLPKRAGVERRGEFQGGSSASSEIAVRVNGPDTGRLLELAEEIARRLEAIKGLEGVRVDAESGLDELTVRLERDRAAAMGVSPEVASQVIAFQLSGLFMRDYQRGEDLLPLRVRTAPPTDAHGRPRDPNLGDVGEIRLPSEGGQVAAKAVTETTGLATPGFGEIRRRNRQTSLRVVGTTSSEDLQRIRGEVEAALKQVNFPPGYSRELGGRFEEFEKDSQELVMSLMWAALLVFLLMCFLFESVLKPLCIITVSVPGAILGGWGLLWATGTPNDKITWLGLLILVGVVVNNGIVMVDLVNRLRAEGVDRGRALLDGCSQRMRPILMTSLTTAFGLVPMAMGDATFVGTPYFPMGRMVLGGLLVSMCYTMLFVPLLYAILDDIGLAFRGWTATVLGARNRKAATG